jgi:hypothetical protein
LAKNVQSIIDDLESGLTQLRMHFESLGSIFGGEKASARGRRNRSQLNTGRVDPYKNFKFRVKKGRKSQVKASGPAKKTRKRSISPARRAQMKLQGRYMALVKHLPKAKQARVKKVRKAKGYEAALKMMGC